MASWLVSQVPWWAWTVLAIVAALMLWPVWTALPNSVKAAIVTIGGVGLVYLAGRNRGAKDAEHAQAERDAGAVKTRQEIDQEVGRLDDPDLNRKLDKWMRDDG